MLVGVQSMPAGSEVKSPNNRFSPGLCEAARPVRLGRFEGQSLASLLVLVVSSSACVLLKLDSSKSPLL